ncbi:MAG: hypothetical protein KL785_03570 [Brevundimonas sp.]|nr:hypothetical protein [Brevundimonas sp.]
MSRSRTEPTPVLLDAETWEVPFRLSVDDLYLQAGADRRAGPPPADDREDDR